MDECHFQQHGSRLAAWFHLDEKDPVVQHAPTRKKMGIIGAVRAGDGKLVAREEEKFNAQTVESFFSELFQHRDTGKIMVVVLDNARFHHAKALSEWLTKHSREFCLAFLPPYSPELNHIERVWKLIRRLCTHNRYFEHLTDLRQAVFSKISEWVSPNDTLAQLCAIN
ncbi:MAG: IS630 family transposase [Deltaproteobacteria bacterium]|nr:IS630 family transposase [Deltaproteobacteria bacterium]